MVRSQLNSYSGADPIWGFVALIGSERFTGEAAVGVDPRLRLFAVDGRVYFAERDGDLPVGSRLVNCGAVTATQLELGSVRVGDTDSLARLFQRQPMIDRDAVELTIELATEALLESVADKPVGMPEVFPLRHHPAGIHHWARPAASPSGSVPMAAAPLTLPTAADTEPVASEESAAAPAEATITEPVAAATEAVAEPTHEWAPEPTAEVAPEPAHEWAPEATAEVAPEPTHEWAPEPIAEVDALHDAADAPPEPVAETPALHLLSIEVADEHQAPTFAPLAGTNGTHASWQAGESIFDRPREHAPEATPDHTAEDDHAAETAELEPHADQGFTARTLPSLTPLPPLADASHDPVTPEPEDRAEMAEEGTSTPVEDALHHGFTSLPTLEAVSTPADKPEQLHDIFAPESTPEPALPSFSSLSSLQPLQPTQVTDEHETAATEATEQPAEPALPTLAALPTLGHSAADFFDSLPEPSMYEPGVLPADLPKLASGPISMDDLAVANAEPVGPWSDATHNLAAVQIWEMVDDIMDDGQTREPEMASGAGSEKRGRGWLRGRKG